MRGKIVLAAGGAAALCLLAVGYFVQDARFRAVEGRLEHEADAREQEGSTRVRAEAALAALSLVRASKDQPKAEGAVEAPQAQPVAAQQAKPKPQLTEADQEAHVASVFSQETTDGAWASVAQSTIDGALRRIVESSVVERLECRKTLCKASLTHRDEERYTAFVDRLLANHRDTWTSGMYWHKEGGEDGSVVRSSLYFVREGQTLPIVQ